VNTPTNIPPTMTPRRRPPWRSLGIIALATAVVVPGAAIAQSSRGDAPARISSVPDEVAVVPTPTAGDLTSSVAPVPTTAENEATRATVAAYLDQLQEIVDGEHFAPAGQPQLPLLVADLPEAVDSASALVDELTGAELSALQSIIDANPAWASQPDLLSEAIAANPFDLGESGNPGGYRAPSGLRSAALQSSGTTRSVAIQAADAMAPAALLGPGDPAGIYTDCQQAAPDVRALFYSAWVAAQIAGAAGAVASGIPDALDYIALTIIAGVAFGVANGIAIGLNHALTIALDCVAAKDDAEFRKTLPTHPTAVTATNPTGITPGSTQTSVDQLATAVAGVITTVTDVNLRIQQILGRQLAVIESIGLAASSAAQVQSTAADLQVRAKDLKANIGTASDQAVEANRPIDCTAVPAPDSEPCNTANGLANTTNSRLDTILADTGDLRSLTLRINIERALSEPSNQPNALYALPADRGGHLELVGDIVARTIADLEAAGESTGNAPSFLATAAAALAAGDFVGAYVAYAKAYQAAAR
jgi:hypothetical protein